MMKRWLAKIGEGFLFGLGLWAAADALAAIKGVIRAALRVLGI